MLSDEFVLGEQGSLGQRRLGNNQAIKWIAGPVNGFGGHFYGLERICAECNAKIHCQGPEYLFRPLFNSVYFVEKLYLKSYHWRNHQVVFFQGFGCALSKAIYFARVEPENDMRITMDYGRHR